MKVIFTEDEMDDIRERKDRIDAKRESEDERVEDNDFALNELGADSEDEQEDQMVRLEAGESLDDDSPESIEDVDSVERLKVWELDR